MKKISHILFFSCFCCMAFAQNVLEQRVDFNAKNLPLKTAIFKLSEQLNTGFTFSGHIIPNKNITVRFEQAKAVRVLSYLFANTNIAWKVVDRQIILFKKEEQQYFTISGYIKDAETGERLLAANIIENNSKKGIASNEYGFYSITLPKGPQILNFSFLGYKTKTEKINLKRNLQLTIALKPSLTLGEVIVSSKGLVQSSVTIKNNKNAIPIQEIPKLPALGGEGDLLRTINLLAGVQTGTDGFGGLNIRGGSVDQNLMLLDGVPVYNANHLGGLFSVFNSSAIKSAQLHRGDFPARFGGRLSSVLDVRTKEGNQRTFSGELSVGLIALKAAIEGPIIQDKSSYFISFRRSIFGGFLKPISRAVKKRNGDTGETHPTFSDFNGKTNIYLGKKDQLFISFYHGNDNFRDENRSIIEGNDFRTIVHDQTLDWGNTIGVLRWNHLFSDKLFANTTLNFSKFWFKSIELYEERVTTAGQSESDREQDILFYNQYNSSIGDKSVKVDFDFLPSTNHAIKFGLGFTNHVFRPGAFTLNENSAISLNEQNEVDSIISVNNRVQSQDYVAYIEDHFTILPNLKANLGIRGNLIHVQATSYFSLQPRISFHYLLNTTTSWTASFGKMMQNLHLLTTSGIGLPTDLWVPSTANIKPQSAWQGTIGFQKNFKKGLTVEVESYLKKMQQLINYQEGSSFLIESFILDASNWENKVTTGTGRSYGVEVSLKKTSKQLNGWLSYTFSNATRQFKDVNFGKTYTFKFDRPHSFKMAVAYQLNHKVNVSANWAYESGIPTTLPTSAYTFTSSNLFSPISVLSIDGKNNIRFPASHRLDVGVTIDLTKNKITQALKLGIYNVYNRKNPLYYRLREKSDGSGEKEFVSVTLLPITPALSYSLQF